MASVSDYGKFRREELVIEKEIFVVKIHPGSLGYDSYGRIVSALGLNDKSVVCPYVVGTPPKSMGDFDRSVYYWSLKHDENGRPVRAFAKDNRTFVNLEGKVLADFGRKVDPSSIGYDKKGRPVNALAKQRYIVDVSGRQIFDFGRNVYFNEICRDRYGRPLSALAADGRTVVGKNGKVLGRFKHQVPGGVIFDGEGRPLSAVPYDPHGGIGTFVNTLGRVVARVSEHDLQLAITGSFDEDRPVRYILIRGIHQRPPFDFGQEVHHPSIRYNKNGSGIPVTALATDDQTVLQVRKNISYVLPGNEFLGLIKKGKNRRK